MLDSIRRHAQQDGKFNIFFILNENYRNEWNEYIYMVWDCLFSFIDKDRHTYINVI